MGDQQKFIIIVVQINYRNHLRILGGLFMSETEIEYIVENFKGILWDELEDDLSNMSREDLQALVLALKKRFG